MKNTVPKNDKKRRKQLSEDICKLEAELTMKQEQDLSRLKDTHVNQMMSPLSCSMSVYTY